MWERIKRLFSPPIFEGDEDKTRMARMLNVVLLAILVAAPIIVLSRQRLQGQLLALSMIVLAGALWLLMRRGAMRMAGILLATVLSAVVTAAVYFNGTIIAPITSGYIMAIMIVGLLVNTRVALVFAVLDALILFGLFQAEIAGLLPEGQYQVTGTSFGQWIIHSISFVIVAVLLSLATGGVSEALGRARRYASELEGQRNRLESLVGERTRELARRTGYLGAATAVAREAQAAGGDLARLLPRVVDVISEQFGFYHTGLFLLDERKEWAVLRAASSEGGRRMLDQHHRLQVGSQSIVGYVTARGEQRIALDVGRDAVFFDNPDMPGTRSEMAVPLRVRGQVLGALDVQSTEPQAFTDEDVAVLQALADQVAMAVSNAQLLQQLEEGIEGERRAMGELTREAWSSLLQARQALGFFDDGSAIVPAGDMWQPEMDAALNSGTRAWSEQGASLAIPIRVREQVVGVIDGFKDEGVPWSEEEVSLLETVAVQLGVALEGAQLYADSQRRAARERLVGEVTGRMRESLDLEAVLRTATSEIRQALGLSDLVIRLAEPQKDKRAR